MSLELKPKQQSVVDIGNDCPEVDTIYLIGAVGTGKTNIAAVSASIFVTHLRRHTGRCFTAKEHWHGEAIGHSVVPSNSDRSKNSKEGREDYQCFLMSSR